MVCCKHSRLSVSDDWVLSCCCIIANGLWLIHFGFLLFWSSSTLTVPCFNMQRSLFFSLLCKEELDLTWWNSVAKFFRSHFARLTTASELHESWLLLFKFRHAISFSSSSDFFIYKYNKWFMFLATVALCLVTIMRNRTGDEWGRELSIILLSFKFEKEKF